VTTTGFWRVVGLHRTEMLDLEIHNKKVMTSGHFKANHKKGGYKIVLGIYF